MLLPRTQRCNQLNLTQQRLACESFPISSTFQAVYKVAAPPVADGPVVDEANFNRLKTRLSRFSIKKIKEKFVEPLCLKNRSLRVSLDSSQTTREDKRKESVY